MNTEQFEKMRNALEKISNWLACYPIATAEDMAQSFPEMLRLSDDALQKIAQTQ